MNQMQKIPDATRQLVEGKFSHKGVTCADRLRWFRKLVENYGYDGPVPDCDPTDDPPPKIKKSLKCIHRGEHTHIVGCGSCGDGVRVYECALHEECALRENKEQVRACESCDDREPPGLPIVEGEEWAVGVTTAPRSQPTLRACLESLQANGWNPDVYAEPGSDLMKWSGPVVHRPKKLGCFHNWLDMIRDLLRRYPDAKWILTVQDDTAFAPNAKRFVEQLQWPSEKCGMISLYTSRLYTQGKKRPPGAFKTPLRNWWGALAMCFRRETAERLVECRAIQDWNWENIPKNRKAKNPANVRHLDTAIGNALKSLREELWSFHPSLSQHVAEVSSLNNGGNQENRRAWKVSQNPLVDCVPKQPAKKFDFRTYGDLIRDCKKWAGRLCNRIGAVCGIPRAGVLVASILSEEMHVPLIPLDALLENREGYRPGHSRELVQSGLPILVVDDSSTSGRTLKEVQGRLAHRNDLLFGAAYCTERAAGKVQIDASASTIQVGHSFEWIILRDWWCRAYCVDMDGVICEDWHGDETKEPERYRQHLINARPQQIPRKPLLAVVTSRLERYREETETWLKRHGVEYQSLIMHPAKTPEERSRQKGFAPWKARQFQQVKNAVLFVESCPHQARDIHRLSKMPTLCLPAMEFHS